MQSGDFVNTLGRAGDEVTGTSGVEDGLFE
jgi:hypothetical protein